MTDVGVISARTREVVRDLAMLFVSAAVAAFIAAGAPWGFAILPILGKAGLTAVGAQIVLWITPLTRRYGVGKPHSSLVEEHLEKVPV